MVDCKNVLFPIQQSQIREVIVELSLPARDEAQILNTCTHMCVTEFQKEHSNQAGIELHDHSAIFLSYVDSALKVHQPLDSIMI